MTRQAASFWRKTRAGFVETGMNHTSSPRLRLYVERPIPRMAAIPRGGAIDQFLSKLSFELAYTPHKMQGGLF